MSVAVSMGVDETRDPTPRTASLRALLPAASLVALAFAVRLVTLSVHGSGGLGGVYGYDAGVYYAASDSLLQGLLPYRDFVLLHPPGLMLALTPFAALGRLTTDHTGYVLANLAFVGLGAVNAGLVFGLARRLGAGVVAAWIGGAFYALWYSAILAEVSLRLEPLAAFTALLGGFVLARPGAGRRAAATAGALFAFSACVKIWWTVPLLVVLVAVVVARRRLVGAFLAGTAATALIVLVPFFLAAPGVMWRMVVRDQLGRADGGLLGLRRYELLSSLSTADVTGRAARLGLVVVAVGVVGLVVLALRTRPGRIVAVLFVAQAVTLVLSPTYFSFYGGFLAPAAALLVAMSGAGKGRPLRLLTPAAVALAAVGALTAVSIANTAPISVPFPRRQLAGVVAHVRCVGTDSPVALVQLDALSRNLRDGCPNWVDVTGRTYDVDAAPHGVSRRRNARWQADLLRYLRGNEVALVIRRGTGLSARTQQTIRSWPVVRRVDGVTLRAVPPAPGRTTRRSVSTG